jgi:ADP-heptose:LPS heptosyltransferase
MREFVCRSGLARYRYRAMFWRYVFCGVDALGERLPKRLVTLGRKAVWPPQRILVAQMDHMGDAVLSSDMPRLLKRAFPGAAVDLLCSRWNEEVFANNPFVDRRIVSRRNWLGRLPAERAFWTEVRRLLACIRRGHYDVAIDVRGDFLVILLLWLAGVPRRVGNGSAGGGFLLTDLAPWSPGEHQLEQRRRLLESLGIPAEDLRPTLYPSPHDRATVAMLLHAVRALRPVIVLHVGAGTAAKRWPLSHYVELARLLYEQTRGTLICVGGPEDLRRAHQLDRAGFPGINWVGKLTVLQLAALLEEADLFVGPDSGPAHVAAAAGTRTIALFSGTNDAAQWCPIGPRVVVLRYPTPCSPCGYKVCVVNGHPCMNRLRPQAVFRAACDLLERNWKDSKSKRIPQGALT